MVSGNSKDNGKEMNSIDAAPKTIHEERERLIYLFQKGIVTEGDIAGKLTEINGRMNILTVRKRDLERQSAASDVSTDFLVDVKELADKIGPEIDELSFEEKQHLIRLMITKIELMLNKNPGIYIKGIRIGGQ